MRKTTEPTRKLRMLTLTLLAAFAGTIVLFPSEQARAQSPSQVPGNVAAEVAKWSAKKVKEAYDEYKKMREAQSEQKKAEQRLKSQKEFEADWYKKHYREIKEKERELKEKQKADKEKNKKTDKDKKNK